MDGRQGASPIGTREKASGERSSRTPRASRRVPAAAIMTALSVQRSMGGKMARNPSRSPAARISCRNRPFAATPHLFFATRIFDQDSTHCFRRRRVKMSAILKDAWLLPRHQSHKCFARMVGPVVLKIVIRIVRSGGDCRTPIAKQAIPTENRKPLRSPGLSRTVDCIQIG